jgi:thiol-disulfide isomerase/thioredoxin
MEIIKIGAMWCPGCIVMKKTFKQIEEDFNIEIKSLDLDFDEEEVSKYNVGDTLPVIIVNKDGKEIKRIIGEKSYQELKSLLEEVM